MLTFTLIVLGLFVIGLLIEVCSLADKVSEMESDSLFSPTCPNYGKEIDRVEKMLTDSFGVNAQVFDALAKELGKGFTKTRVIKDAGRWDEKIVTKFELVDLPKVKKTK